MSTDDLVRGSIVRLKLKNFMTYDEIEYYPVRGLNVILGPNGSGKSTIICGICLGLGGKPSSIGRSNHISEFVKTGCNEAFIEIELFDQSRVANLIISREIHSNNHNSVWKINGKLTTLKMVEKEVSNLNIQCNNLCQFLPQEKVADFSKMNSKELLESTEQAVGDQSMFDNHMKLKNARAKHCELFRALKTYQNLLSSEEEKNKRLQSDVELYKEREKYLKKIAILEKRIPWVQYGTARAEIDIIRENRKKISEEIGKANAAIEPARETLEEFQKQVVHYQNVLESLGLKFKKFKDDHFNMLQKVEICNCKISDVRGVFKDKEKKEADRIEKLDNSLGLIKIWENELMNPQKTEKNLENQLAALQALSQKTQVSMSESCTQKQTYFTSRATLQSQYDVQSASLNKLKVEEESKLNYLRRREPHALESVLWLRKNKEIFKKMIHEPILTVLSVVDPRFTKYVESHIAYRDLVAFVAEDAEDMNKFLSILSDEQHLDISAVLGADSSASSAPGYSVEELRSIGLDCCLKDLIKAPPAVMNFLCKRYNIHKIPVGFEYSKHKLDYLINKQNVPFSTFFLGDYKVKTSISRYGEHSKSVETRRIRSTGMLMGGVSSSEITELEQSMKELHTAIRASVSAHNFHLENENKYGRQLEDLRKQKQALILERDMRVGLKGKIENKRRVVEHLKSESVDLEAEKKNLSIELSNECRQKLDILKELCECIKKTVYLEDEKTKSMFQFDVAVKGKIKAQKNFDVESNAVVKLEQRKKELDVELKMKTDVCRKLLDHAHRICGFRPGEQIDYNILSEQFKNIPETLDELEVEINKERAKLDCICETDPVVVQDYMKRQDLISKTKSEILVLEEQLSELNKSISDLKDSWLPNIESLMKKISRSFSSHFFNLGCAGEVSLDKTENPEDFDKYGISIKVKFHDAQPLTPLSNTHHSGGECAVATILFMLSLQELTEVPFRCVDEINQGMDSENERKIFNLLVKNSCKKNSQYFLVTPKLLCDLEFSEENLQVSVIYNGSTPTEKWDMNKFIQTRRAINSL